MAAREIWYDRRRELSDLADGHELGVTHDPMDMLEHAASQRARIFAIKDAGSPNEVYLLARSVARIANMSLDADGRQWIFNESPKNPGIADLVWSFRQWAANAAVTAGLVGPDAPKNKALIAWLTLLKSRSSDMESGTPPYRENGIDNLVDASARMCNVLASEA